MKRNSNRSDIRDATISKKVWLLRLRTIICFVRNKSLNHLPPRIDKYFKADFGGRDPATNKPILIDVTTNPYPKLKKVRVGELKEVLSEFGFFESPWD